MNTQNVALAVLDKAGSSKPYLQLPVVTIVLHPTEECILSLLSSSELPKMDLSLLARVHAFVRLRQLNYFSGMSYGRQLECIWNSIILRKTEHTCLQTCCGHEIGYLQEAGWAQIQEYLLRKVSFGAMMTPQVASWFLLNGFQIHLFGCSQQQLSSYSAKKLLECFPNHRHGVVGSWGTIPIPDGYYRKEDVPSPLLAKALSGL